MRLAEREIKDPHTIGQVLDGCDIMTVALQDGAAPYVVPVNFDYQWSEGHWTFYFHCAPEGKKLDCLAAHPQVGLCCCRFLDYHGDEALPPHNKKEDYASVIATGTARILQGEEAVEALKRFAWRTASDDAWQKVKKMPGNLLMVAIDVAQLTCKVENPDPAWMPEMLRLMQATVRVRPRMS